MDCKYCKADCVLRGEEREKECKGYIPMTNAERIRAMSDEELALFLADEVAHGDCYGCGIPCVVTPPGEFGSSCTNAHYQWLKQPVDTDNHDILSEQHREKTIEELLFGCKP